MYQYDASKYDASFRYPNFYQKKKKNKNKVIDGNTYSMPYFPEINTLLFTVNVPFLKLIKINYDHILENSRMFVFIKYGRLLTSIRYIAYVTQIMFWLGGMRNV